MTLEIVLEAPIKELTDEEKQAIKAAAIEELRALIPDGHEALLLKKPGCGPCMGIARDFTAKGIKGREIDLSQDAEALETLKRAGYQTAPVVITRDDHWFGFDTNKIDEILATRIAA